ncbi:MAG: VanZ family protein [Terriglobales bacterium]
MIQVGNALYRRVLLGLCLCVLAGVLAFGLWPFTSRPHNDVSWIRNQNGLVFGDYGSILSSAPLRVDESPDGPCSLELWLQPGLIHDANTMLAFDSPENSPHFGIEQSLDNVALERTVAGHKTPKSQIIYIPHVLRRDTPLFITLTSGQGGLSIYVNGAFVRSSSAFSFTRRDLSDQMVVGNSPFANDSWSGVLRGIGLYNKELTAEEIRQNYAAWTASGQPRALAEKEATAVFTFGERTGTVVHNQVPGGIDLYIPDHYLVLHPPFLQAFWRLTDSGWGFWKNALINVGGFVPLGFFFGVYFSQSMPVPRATLLTIILGCAVSFLIEVTQYYLPTRDSGSLDLITNTLGTMLGALMYGPGFVQRILARFGIVSRENAQVNPAPGDPLLKAESDQPEVLVRKY